MSRDLEVSFVRIKFKFGSRFFIGGHVGTLMLYTSQKDFQYKFCITGQRQNCSSTRHVISVLLEVAIGGQWDSDMCLQQWHKMSTSSGRVVDPPHPHPNQSTTIDTPRMRECCQEPRLAPRTSPRIWGKGDESAGGQEGRLLKASWEPCNLAPVSPTPPDTPLPTPTTMLFLFLLFLLPSVRPFFLSHPCQQSDVLSLGHRTH